MKNKDIDLESYVDRLVEEKNLPKDLIPEVVKQIKSDLLQRVENRIDAVIISNLNETQLEEFNKILDKENNDEEVQSFLSKSIPSLAELIASELIVFRQTYLS